MKMRSCNMQQIRRMITVSRPTLFDVINPATGKTIAELPDDSPQDIAEKFERLSGGQKRWNALPVFERRETLERFNELLRLNMNSLAQILTSEMGKPIKQSKNEIRATVDRVKFYLTHYEKVLGEQTVLETTRLKEKVVYEPLGVIANISAWNYPYFVSANVFAAALLTGNTVLYKPSEYASLSGQEITRLLHELLRVNLIKQFKDSKKECQRKSEIYKDIQDVHGRCKMAGVPKDAFMLSTGKGETGSAVASLEGLGGIFFTGSFKTGLEIAKTAAPNLVKVQLELGGKDPVYVRHDVPNVAAAAASIADGAFYNCGQSCCSVERIYVDKKIYPEFVDNFVKTVKSFKMGDPLSDETYIGPVARKPQVPYLASQVIDALRKGANAAVGGEMSTTGAIPSGGFWFPPTVLTDVNHTMIVMREESFGPLIGIQMVDGDAEALNLMRDTPYGLTASVFCKSSSDAEAILRELEVGTGYWNCCDRVSPRLPWSGRKASGIGATLGMDGLRSFVQPKGFFLQRPC